MDEKKIHKIFLDEVSPIDIPLPDEAWQNMQKKLVEEDKEKLPAKWRLLYPAAVILILIVIGWFLQNDFDNKEKLANKKETHQSIPVKTKTDKDSLYKAIVRNRKRELQQMNRSGSNNPKTDNGNPKKQNALSYAKTKEKNLRQLPKDLMKPSPGKPAFTPYISSLSKNIEISKNYNTPEIYIDTGKSTPQLADSKLIADINKKEENSAESKKEGDAGAKLILAGLQWNVQIPVNSLTGYFAGPNSAAQPYRLLLPGFWISVQAERIMLTAEVNPFASAMLSNKPYTIKNVMNGAENIAEFHTLHKIFGTAATFSFDYHIKKSWWAGGNVQGNFWHSGIATAKGEKINSSAGGASVIYTNNYSLNDSSWTDFNKFQAGLGMQLLYKLPKWQAGIRFNYYLVSLIEKAGQKNQTGTQFFIRRQLYKEKN